MSRLRVWASDAYAVPLPSGHPFPMAKYRALRELLLAEGIVVDGRVSRSEPAPVEWLLRAHDLPVVITLGGGYGRPLESTVRAHASVFRVAAAALSRCGTTRSRGAAGGDPWRGPRPFPGA